MRVKVDGAEYGVSFRHEFPESDASDTAKSIATEMVMTEATVDGVAEMVQQHLDKIGRALGAPNTTLYGRLPRRALRKHGTVTSCTIWRGKRPLTREEWEQPGGETEIVARGTATCSALDTFNKEVGRNVALGRAIASLPDTTKEAILGAYRGRRRKSNGKSATA